MKNVWLTDLSDCLVLLKAPYHPVWLVSLKSQRRCLMIQSALQCEKYDILHFKGTKTIYFVPFIPILFDHGTKPRKMPISDVILSNLT